VISVYKIQSSHTIHMVKGAAKTSASSSSSGSNPTSGSTTASSGTAQALPRMQTGQNVHDPLTQLNSHMGFGAMAGLNPFAEMGLNPNDPNMVSCFLCSHSSILAGRLMSHFIPQLQTMMNSPEFMQQMSSMLSNPAVMEQVIAQNPQLQQMAPQIRESLNSPMFREMMYVVSFRPPRLLLLHPASRIVSRTTFIIAL
jgi:ubiquilin